MMGKGTGYLVLCKVALDLGRMVQRGVRLLVKVFCVSLRWVRSSGWHLTRRAKCG